MAAAIDQNREIVARERADTPKNLNDGLACLKELAKSVSKGTSIVAIGASAGGPLDYLTGVVSSLHFPEWHGVPLKQIMEDEFKCPFSVDVDTNAAALAEYTFTDHRAERLLYLTLSTGMGGGFIVNGEIYRGANGSHPEVGHQAIPYQLPVPGPIPCLCGGSDCLEAIICGSAIRKIYGKPAENLSVSEWAQVGFNLGQGLRNLTVIYAPDLIVLGGSMALGGGERLLAAARSVVQENVKIVPVPRIELSSLGYDTALWGALALAMASGGGEASENL
jgi:predicted NBD/HSP70 family sugar kinase